MTITSTDPLQPGYTYDIIEPRGQNFDARFTPDLSPQQMLELGVFGGCYFSGIPMEFPSEWFAQAKLSEIPDSSLNNFGVSASQPLEVWQKKGWIYPEDPRGWFQWYCRYYLGRRIPLEDARQIKRWYAMRRHIAQIKLGCKPGDMSCRPKQRQALLHWAYTTAI